MKIFKEIKIMPVSPFKDFSVQKIVGLDFGSYMITSHKVFPNGIICSVFVRLLPNGSPYLIGGIFGGGSHGNRISYNHIKKQTAIRALSIDGLALENKKAFDIFYELYGIDANPTTIKTAGSKSKKYDYSELRPFIIKKHPVSKTILELWDIIHSIAGGNILVEVNKRGMWLKLVDINPILFDYLDEAAHELD